MDITQTTNGRCKRHAVAFVLAIIMVGVSIISPGNIVHAVNAPGGYCTYNETNLGDTSGSGTNDSGVATWVGRDMYIGGRPDDTSLLDNEHPIPGSYAVEAEGLTLVNGKLALHPLKNSWSNRGFRFTAAGFGSQFRPQPADGTKTGLVVANNNSGITVLKTGDNNGVGVEHPTASVGAWNNGGFVGSGYDRVNGALTKPADNLKYNARIYGPWTEIYKPSDGVKRDSIVGNANQNNTWSGPKLVEWDLTPNLMDSINGVDYNNYRDTGKDYTEWVKNLSSRLDSRKANGTTNVGVAPNDSNYWRNKYNINRADLRYKFIFDDNHREKLITFTGDGVKTETGITGSRLQVFQVKASDLISAEYAGVSFAFTNIPDNASVTVNVVDDDGAPFTGEVDFHNGWRFWWNGLEIGNGYTEYAPNNPGATVTIEQHDQMKKAYSTAAKAVMWNFSKASKVTIRGGTYNGQTDNGSTSQDSIGVGTHQIGDDPAAAMLGSIMTPYGTFDSHVTTNGRVWTGGDFMMNNPVAVKKFSGANTDNGLSSSVIDMDQERHNSPWTGIIPDECSSISWAKIDGSTLSRTVTGTTWRVYATLGDAVKYGKDGLIATITDDGDNDDDDTPGVLRLDGLKPHANYYLVEQGSAPSQDGVKYEENTNIYLITIEESGKVSNKISHVYAYDGNESEDTLLSGDGSAIINRKVKPTNVVEWNKHGADDRFKPLPGTSWLLKNEAGEETIIDDLVTTVTDVIISNEAGDTLSTSTDKGDVLDFDNVLTLHGRAVLDGSGTTDTRLTSVVWSSSAGDVAAVDSGGNISAGPDADGTKTAIITATSRIDGKVHAELEVRPSKVAGLNIYTDENVLVTGGTIELERHNTQSFNIKPKDDTAVWSSSDEDVATVDSNGRVTAVGSTGSAVITVTSKGKTASITVAVKSSMINATIYVKNDAYSNNYQGKFAANDLWMGYSTGDGQWFHLKTVQSSYTEYNSVNIQTPAGSAIEFYFHDQSSSKVLNKEYTSGDNFKFTVTTGIDSYTVTGGDDYRDGTPLSSLRGARSVNTMDGGMYDVIDMNPVGGRFLLSGLPSGSYELSEYGSVNGYVVNPTVFKFTIHDDGTVTWGTGPGINIVDGKVWLVNERSKVDWLKVDGTSNEPIAGSSWLLQRKTEGGYDDLSIIEDCIKTDDGTNSACDGTSKRFVDVNQEPGKFRVTGLLYGDYRMVEHKAPDGYQLDSGTYYYFSVSASDDSDTVIHITKGDSVGTGNGPGVENNAIANTRLLGSVEWVKKSSDSIITSPLAGSEWKLVNMSKGNGTVASPYLELVVTDCVVSGDSDDRKCPDGSVDVDPDAGRFRVDGLDWGEWRLVETKAPNGYELLTGPDADRLVFTIGDDDEHVVLNVDLKDILNDKTATIHGFPLTGARGVLILAVVVLVTIVGVTIMYRKNRD